MNPIARSLYGRLAEHYADQLQLISSGHPFDVSPDRRFTKLQSLFICYDDKVDYQLPRIASGELVDMKLVGVPPNISWASFGTDSDPRVIEFAKLEKLCLKYMTLRDEDRALLPRQAVQPPDLRFPSLKKLDIHWTEDIVSLFKHAELPPRMESIYIGILSATPEQFAGVVLPETKRLSLGIPMTAFGRSNGLPIINHLFSRARGCESLEMRLGDMTQTIMPDDITCTNLTQLVIAGSVRVDTMLAFIGRMPRLAKLKLDRLDPVNIHTDISVPDADDDAVVEPISNSLKELVISYEWDWPVREILVDVAKYVLLRIPVLDTLVTTNTPRDPILGFVEAYSRRYPHLGRVELDIIEKDGIVGDRRRAGSSARSLITRHVSQES
ncbi:hypothetical protein H4R19_004723 [Coemansia spiralis]|nr:hypothetical protein H4R19_004723 [Coemansia spiralis]